MEVIDKIKDFVGGAQLQSAARTSYKVIDVSEWQKTIDWNKVKSDGVVGAIIRYADGDYLDPKFDYNMRNAKANGLHIGAYIFSRAKTKAGAEKEATRLFNACKKYSPDMPLYIDIEAKGLGEYADTVAPAFLNKMKALGGVGGVYSYLNWWNKYLKKTAKNYPASPFWIAQYNKTMDYKPASIMGIWQYTSSGKVDGIKTRVDMNKCYIAYWNKGKTTTTPKAAPAKKQYTGTFPSYTCTKTNAEVIADTITWCKWIAGDNRFHYGYGEKSHHNGCYFCGTQFKSGKHKGDYLDVEYSYCCNPFVHAGWAHGGCVPKALEMCQKANSWGQSKSEGYEKSSLFTKLGKPSYDKLKAGDVLCSEKHVALYVGNGKVVQAANSDDNKRNSTKWNNSIRISTWNGWTRAYRFNGTVNYDAPIRHGEVGARVRHLQLFLAWYGIKIIADGIFGDATLKAVKQFQKEQKLTADGIVGKLTIAKMKEVKK